MWEIISITITRIITPISFTPSPYQSQEWSSRCHPQVIIIIPFTRVFHPIHSGVPSQVNDNNCSVIITISLPQCYPFNPFNTIILFTRRSSLHQQQRSPTCHPHKYTQLLSTNKGVGKKSWMLRETEREADRQTETDRQTLDLLLASPITSPIIIRDISKFKKTSTNSISNFLKKCKNAKK